MPFVIPIKHMGCMNYLMWKVVAYYKLFILTFKSFITPCLHVKNISLYIMVGGFYLGRFVYLTLNLNRLRKYE